MNLKIISKKPGKLRRNHKESMNVRIVFEEICMAGGPDTLDVSKDLMPSCKNATDEDKDRLQPKTGIGVCCCSCS